MATLKTILALGSTIPNNVVSSSLLTTITKNNTVTAGGVLAITIDAITEGTAITLLTAGYHPLGTKVYLRNLETTAKTLKFKCTGDVNYEIICRYLNTIPLLVYNLNHTVSNNSYFLSKHIE